MNGCSYSIDLIDFTSTEVNQLRRLVMSRITTIAVNEVIFTTNTSTISDEVIAQRLGLVTIKVPDMYIDQTFQFSVDVECVGNSIFATSDSMKFVKGDGIEIENLQVIGNLPLAKLFTGQKISLLCNASRGCGEEHARWSPVTKCVYEPVPEKTNQFKFHIHVNEPFNAKEIFQKALKLFYQN